MKKIFAKESRFNKLLRKLSNRQIILHYGVFYIQTGKIPYTCTMCSKHTYELPNFKGGKYIYKIDETEMENTQNIKIQDEILLDDIKIYGYSIEWSRHGSNNWDQYYNHKIYNSKRNVLDAIIQIKSNGYSSKYEFRVVPVYSVNQNYFRNIVINKIIS